MSEYTPTVWRTGDVITAEKLNKIEEGIANAESVTVESLSITENGTYSEEGKAYSPVVVNVANDYATAKVIFIIDDSITEPFYIDIVTLYDNKMYTGVDTADIGPEGIDAVLYKGAGGVRVDSSYSVKVKSVTGNATIKTPLHVDITGDCSITYELDSVIT